jgi:hypothetical protein
VLRIFDASKDKVLTSFEAPKEVSAAIETVAKPAK